MNNKRIRKKFTLGIFLVAIINILVVILGFTLEVLPIINKSFEVVEVIEDNDLFVEYSSFSELEEDIDDISSEYNVQIFIEDVDGNEVISPTNQTKIKYILLSQIMNINETDYLIKIYPSSNHNITILFIKLFVFNVVSIILVISIIFIFTRQSVFKPVEKIINDIRNYKFGKEPSRNEINNEFDLIQNEFVNLTCQLDDEKQEQNRIIASISHDIKTPLTSIIGYSQLLEDDSITVDEVRKYSEKISSKALHIKDILETFDDYLVNRDNQDLKLSTIKIKDLIKELNDDYKIELESKNIEFNIYTNIENKNIDIDILKIKRVFSNIISNSVRYLSDSGKIEINIDSVDDSFIRFKIKDNGPGVDEKIIKKIFEPLFTTDSSRKISGLGLSICKEFIELHNGKIKAYNNNGLVIEFIIPESIKE